MKTIRIILLPALSIFFANPGFSQNINWRSLKTEQKHILNINSGWDFGLVFGMGYGYQLKTKTPIVISAAYSFPSGNNLFDDFKTKIGGKIRLFNIDHFHLSTSIEGVFRRYGNPLVRLENFGSDLSVIVGYYKPKWFVAAEVGFDKAIVTHLKHSNSYKEIYPMVLDGWYEPATGGNFYYGLQAGWSFKQNDITLKIGKLTTQDFKTTPLIPYYAQLGYNFKINSQKK